MSKHIGSEFDELQLEREAHRKTWRQLGQAQREKAALAGLLREAAKVLDDWKNTDDLDELAEKIEAALSQQDINKVASEPEHKEGFHNCAVYGSDESGIRVTGSPAPAQDERETVEVVGYTYAYESGAYSQYPGEDWLPLMTVTQHERIVGALTRPAQKVNNVDTHEQQPCGYQYQTPDGDWFPIAKSMIAEAEEHGHKVRSVYAAPIAQAEHQPRGVGLSETNLRLSVAMEGSDHDLPSNLTIEQMRQHILSVATLDMLQSLDAPGGVFETEQSNEA